MDVLVTLLLRRPVGFAGPAGLKRMFGIKRSSKNKETELQSAHGLFTHSVQNKTDGKEFKSLQFCIRHLLNKVSVMKGSDLPQS